MAKYYVVTSSETVWEVLCNSDHTYVGTNYTLAVEAASDGDWIFEVEAKRLGKVKLNPIVVPDK